MVDVVIVDAVNDLSVVAKKFDHHLDSVQADLALSPRRKRVTVLTLPEFAQLRSHNQCSNNQWFTISTG